MSSSKTPLEEEIRDWFYDHPAEVGRVLHNSNPGLFLEWIGREIDLMTGRCDLIGYAHTADMKYVVPIIVEFKRGNLGVGSVSQILRYKAGLENIFESMVNMKPQRRIILILVGTGIKSKDAIRDAVNCGIFIWLVDPSSLPLACPLAEMIPPFWADDTDRPTIRYNKKFMRFFEATMEADYPEYKPYWSQRIEELSR